MVAQAYVVQAYVVQAYVVQAAPRDGGTGDVGD
jgi:hypothetical protein